MIFFKSLLIALSLSLVTGCSILSPADYPAQYLLSPNTLPAVQLDLQGPTLLVAQPQAAAALNTTAQLYLPTPYQVLSYRNSEWFAPPAALLLPLLVRYLEATDHFSAVLSEPISSISGELRLDTELLALQQEFFTTPSQVRIQLRAQLLNLRRQTILGVQTFEVVVPAPTEDALGGVQATQQALEQLLKDLARFAAEAVS